jgi:CRP-like cAMP-binding protein
LHNPKFNRTFRVIIENRFVELENRVLQTISSTAEERYLTFLKQYPQLSNRLPNTQIASYLGITPEFLSKIRNKISKK